MTLRWQLLTALMEFPRKMTPSLTPILYTNGLNFIQLPKLHRGLPRSTSANPTRFGIISGRRQQKHGRNTQRIRQLQDTILKVISWILSSPPRFLFRQLRDIRTRHPTPYNQRHYRFRLVRQHKHMYALASVFSNTSQRQSPCTNRRFTTLILSRIPTLR